MPKKDSPHTLNSVLFVNSPIFRVGGLLILSVTLLFLSGCHTSKTNRGYMVRGDWAMEFNRTPWVGCPPDSGCDDERTCGVAGCAGGCNHGEKSGFRRHCGLRPGCSPKRPCCKTLGCGMWIDTSDPNSFGAMGSGVKACGLTPFCSPMKPCGLTPNCGKVVQPTVINAGNLSGGGGNPMMSNGMTFPMNGETLQPTPIMPPQTPTGMPEPPENKPTTIATPNNLLLSRGIVPGVSLVNNGGVVAAAGVATPSGIMTPSGVQLPNGMLHTGAVIRACGGHPNCSPARPCGMSPGCGGLVPVAGVSNNAMMLASTLAAPGMSGGVVPAGGPAMTGAPAGRIPVIRAPDGSLVHAVTGQPINQDAMRAVVQNGNRFGAYPPIGYADNGYNALSRYDALNLPPEDEEEPEEELAEAQSPGARSRMPVPRFHPVPTKPVFQRSEGLPNDSERRKTTPSGKKTASDDRRFFSDDNLAAAMEEAYLAGMSDAMGEVEEELDTQAWELAKAQKQAELVEQAQKLEVKLQRQKALELQARELREREENQRRIAALQAERRALLRAKEEALLRQQDLLADREWDADRPDYRQARWNAEPEDDLVRTARYRETGDAEDKTFLTSAADFLTGRPQNERGEQHSTLSMRTPYGGDIQAESQARPALTSPPRPSPTAEEATEASSRLSVKSWGAGFVSNVRSPLKWFRGDEGEKEEKANAVQTQKQGDGAARKTCPKHCSCPVHAAEATVRRETASQAGVARNTVAAKAPNRAIAPTPRRLPKSDRDLLDEESRLLEDSPGRPNTFPSSSRRDKASSTADDLEDEDTSPYFVQQAFYIDGH